jgi:hypothetical protein
MVLKGSRWGGPVFARSRTGTDGFGVWDFGLKAWDF